LGKEGRIKWSFSELRKEILLYRSFIHIYLSSSVNKAMKYPEQKYFSYKTLSQARLSLSWFNDITKIFPQVKDLMKAKPTRAF
jgi:hypothetical protein